MDYFDPNDKATVCEGNTCVTVYGKAAEVVTAITVTSLVILSVALIVKSLN